MVDLYNLINVCCVIAMNSIKAAINQIRDIFPYNSKISVSIGAILYNIETNKFRYFHPSQSNSNVFSEIQYVRCDEDILRIFSKLRDCDLEEIGRMRDARIRRSAVFVFQTYKFYITKIEPGHIGKRSRQSLLIG